MAPRAMPMHMQSIGTITALYLIHHPFGLGQTVEQEPIVLFVLCVAQNGSEVK
jgi:hypothetical protein